MFSVRLMARPDARMVEVPLEIETELPREFDGVALLSSSGLPRKVKLRAQKDGLKLSTAYKVEQLVADIVRTTLKGSAQDVQRAHDAVRAFLRGVREKRQDGATLVVTGNGAGKIDVLSQGAGAQPAPPAQKPTPPPALQDHRIADLEETVRQLAERVGPLERRIKELESQLSRSALLAGVSGPGLDARAPAQAPRRASAIEAFADGLRAELRGRVQKLRDAHRADAERQNRAAALAAEAQQVLKVDAGETPGRLRDAAAQATSLLSAIDRLGDEIELYDASELMIATQLLGRLEKTERGQDPAPALEGVARAVVAAAKTREQLRDEWVERATALAGWSPIAPASGSAVSAEEHEAVEGSGAAVASLASAGARRADGTVIAKARVLTQESAEPITAPIAGAPRIVEGDPHDPALSHADTAHVEEVLDEDVEELSELPEPKP